jgi:exosortase/archaeosortase family protein
MEKKQAIFVVKFLAIFIVGELLIPFLPLQGIQNAIASLHAGLLGYTAIGNTILIQNTLFVVNEYCIGSVSSLILLAIIFSLKKPELKKKIGLWVAGTIILFLANLVRVYLVLWTGKVWGGEAAELLHIFSWFVVAGLILLVWYYATKKMLGIKQFDELL